MICSVFKPLFIIALSLLSVNASMIDELINIDSITRSNNAMKDTSQSFDEFSHINNFLCKGLFVIAIVLFIAIAIIVIYKKKKNGKETDSKTNTEIKPEPKHVTAPQNGFKTQTNKKPQASQPVEKRAEKPTQNIQKNIKSPQPQEAKQPQQKITIKPTSVPLTTPAADEKPVEVSIYRVNYDAQQLENTNSYAVVKVPRTGCVVRSYREGHTKIRGYKETNFCNSLNKYFGQKFIVSNSIRLNTGDYTRPYEPDIAIIDQTSGLNLRIDVEIDEPYSGISRKPTHCIGEDDARDYYFTDRGWIVIRFTECQVHLAELSCVKLIAKFIQSIYANFSIPAALNSVDDLTTQPKWDMLQAQKWAREYYRENYLNHTFQEVEQVSETVERALNNAEQEEERLVKPFTYLIIDKTEAVGYNKINIQQRDERIKFYPEPHIYTIDGVPADSVTTIVAKFFPVFDARKQAAILQPSNPLFGKSVEQILSIWEQNRVDAAKKGTKLHQHIEEYYLRGTEARTIEFEYFRSFANDHSHLEPYRTEWRIFDEDYSVAGTIDSIVKNGQCYETYDWKRSKNLISKYGETIQKSSFDNCGLGVLADLPDTDFYHYSLQQNIYKYILKKRYQITVDRMYLIVLHPNYSKYYKVEVPDMRDEVRAIFKTLK